MVVSDGRGTSTCEAPALGSEEEVFSVTVMVSRAGLEVVVEAAESCGGGKRLKKLRSLGGSECARAMFWAVAMAVRFFDVGVVWFIQIGCFRFLCNFLGFSPTCDDGMSRALFRTPMELSPAITYSTVPPRVGLLPNTSPTTTRPSRNCHHLLLSALIGHQRNIKLTDTSSLEHIHLADKIQPQPWPTRSPSVSRIGPIQLPRSPR